LINSIVIMVAKKARTKEVKTNRGTISILNRAITDSVIPTATYTIRSDPPNMQRFRAGCPISAGQINRARNVE